MTTTPYVLLALITAVSMACGQLLFKVGAARLNGTSTYSYLTSFLTNGYLIVAICLYAVTILIWIYVLKHLPLSKAYPLTAISYLIVPALGYFLLNEAVTAKVFVGSALIILGVLVTHFD